jgi:acyl-CoA dehydrogenase
MQPEPFDDDGYREKARRWLEANAPSFAIPEGITLDDRQEMERARAWQLRLWEGGFTGIALPTAYGGASGTAAQAAIFGEEESRYRLPRGYIGIGTRMALPAIAKHGTEEQMRRFAEPTLRGDLVWCQLFSEPAAGSDLAALRTKAVRDGDHWIVTGQKLWSSWAHHAQWGILIARTDPDVPKHKGLTFFVLDMASKGIEIRPIRQISGHADFNETFLEEVRIPDDCRIGAPGEGWACTLTVLANERLSPADEGKDSNVADLLALARAGTASNPAALDHGGTRLAIAQAYADERAGRLFSARLRALASEGRDPGVLSSVVKLAYGVRMQKMTGLAMEIQGVAGIAPEPGNDRAQNFMKDYIWSAALRIAGGADEVLRNQIAERILGMPGDIRPDKDVPFSQI